ncbi:MAG: hydrogen peroxide-inducible genes activator [Chlorobi bacterium CHB2]|nr:hydrogen peroxide-inducible genes activator [Chlorobi bacterium CHB2]
MTLVQLSYIVALDTHRHFSIAAKHCHVTQPTLSMQLQQLEEELGVILFDRSKKPVVPTEIGIEVVAQARMVLREAERMGELVNNARAEVSGELRLGIIPTLAPYLLPLFLTKFIEEHPKVHIRIREHTTDELVERLRTNQLDAGILATPLNDSAILEQPLFYEEFIAYVANGQAGAGKKKYILTEEIDPERLWLLEEGHCMRSQIINLCELRRTGDAGRVEYAAGSIETLKKIVEMSAGITMLPELATFGMQPAEGAALRRFHPPAPAREISLVTHRAYVKQQLLDALRQSVLSVIPERMKSPEKKSVVEVR